MIDINIKKMVRDIKRYDKLVIYGAGIVAKRVNAELVKNDIFAEYCVVSQMVGNRTYFENMPVFPVIDQIYDMQKEKTITLIAATDAYAADMKKTLLKYHVKNYILFSQYRPSVEDYKGKSDKDILYEIAACHVDKQSTISYDVETVQNELICAIKNRKEQGRKIIFVVCLLSPRVVKIASALKNEGYIIDVLFCGEGNGDANYLDKLVGVVNTCTFCSTVEELLYDLIVSKAIAIHIFSWIWSSGISRILVEYKKFFPKIVFEEYDITNEMYINKYYPPHTLEDERFCLEHADGVCCRGYEQDYLIEQKQYQIEGKVIKFFDYCQDDIIDYSLIRSKSELSLCYAGGISVKQEAPDNPLACFLEFAELCEKNHCHFHVYPSTWNERRYEEFIRLDSKSKYFHFHQPVPCDRLKRELSQYDYGVHLVRKDYQYREVLGDYTREKFIYSVTNHFYDYLDAGLPIIAPAPTKFVEYFKGNGVLIDWTLEEFDFEELRRRKAEFYDNVVRLREELRVKNHIHKLIDFYNSL